MRVSVRKDRLADALARAMIDVLMRQSSLPQGGLLISAERDGSLFLRGVNSPLDILVQLHEDVEVLEPGQIAVAPADPLIHLVKQISDEQVEITSSEGAIRMQTLRGRYTVQAVSPDAFPAEPDRGLEVTEVPAELLRRVVRQVVPAASTGGTSRKVFEGIHVRMTAGTLLAEATDEVRVARLTVDGIPDRAGQDVDVVVPATSLSRAIRSLPREGTVRVRWNREVLTLDADMDGDQISITLQSLAEVYPDLERVFGWSSSITFRTDRAALLAACDRASVLQDRGSVPVRLHVRPDGMAMSVARKEMGQGSEELSGSGVLPDDKDEEVRAFNGLLLLDGLRALDSEEALLEFVDLGPVRLREGGESDNYQYMLMPLRDFSS